MAAMTNAEIGAIVYGMVDGISAAVSGVLTTLVNQAVYTAENYTGNDISVASIDETYQPAVTNLTVSNVLSSMEAQGIGTKTVSVGELSIAKGMVEGASQNFSKLAFSQLNQLGHSTSYYQTY